MGGEREKSFPIPVGSGVILLQLNETDLALLGRYTRDHAEDAFSEVVRRHLDLVHSAALRQVRSAELAEEVAQSTFLKLARHAPKLPPHTILAAWLYQVARRESIDVVRREGRRHLREQIAVEMNAMNATADAWTQIEPLLDDAMEALDEADRAAILLRFFENKSLREVGHTLGTTDDTARKRVNRAIERLREFFSSRGIAVGASGLVVVISAHAVQAAPVGLSATLSASVLAGITIPPSATAATTKGAALTAWQTASISSLVVLTVAVLFYVQHRAGEAQRGRLALQLPSGLSNSAISASSSPPATAVLASGKPREPFASTAAITLSTPPGAIAIQADGKILAGTRLMGWFIDEASGTLGWYSRGALRFEANGTLDRSFFVDVGPPSAVNPMASHLSLLPDGRILLSGSFGSIDDKRRLGHAILLPDGRVDETFEPWRGSTNVNPQTWQQGGPATGTILTNGSVAVLSFALGGSKASWSLTSYRMDASGRIHEPRNSWPEFGYPPGLALTLGWGGFWGNRSIDWTREIPLTKRTWSPAGTQRPPVTHMPFDLWVGSPNALQAAVVLRTLFEEVPIELCRYAVRLPDGGVIMAVRDGGIRGRFMRFDKDWKPDFSFTNQFDSETTSCMSLKRLPDGKLLVAGLVGKMNGEDFSGLVRLEQNGAVDRGFRCETSNDVFGRVLDLASQADGRIVICGYFTQVNGVPCSHLARLNPNGSLDPTFKPPFVAQAELDQRRFLRVKRLTGRPGIGPATASGATNAVYSETIWITSLKLEPGAAIIQFTGQPGQVYVLQTRETMNDAEWITVNTNRAGSGGTGVLRDDHTEGTVMRFYRVATP